jgi:DNA-binding transcriptional LysR family regulator
MRRSACVRVNLIHLSTLEAITRLGTLAAAADELGYTPGALSQQMEALSRSVGAPVLVRVGRLVELTDVGRAVARHAQDVLAAERRLLDEVAESGATITDELVLGAWGSTAAGLLAQVIKTAHTRHAGLVVHSKEVDVDDAADAVHRRTVDAAFGLNYSDSPLRRLPEVSLIQLRVERFGVAVPRTDPRAGSTMRLRDLKDDPWVLPSASTVYGHAMRVACRRAGFEPLVAHELTDTAATLTLASRGLGVAPVTDLMLELSPVSGVSRIELEDDVERELVLIAPDGFERRRSLTALIDVVRAAVPGPDEVPGAPTPGERRTGAHLNR